MWLCSLLQSSSVVGSIHDFIFLVSYMYTISHHLQVLTILKPLEQDRHPQLHVLPLYTLKYAPKSSDEGIEVRPVEKMVNMTAPHDSPPPVPSEISLHPLPASHMAPQRMYPHCSSNFETIAPQTNLSRPPLSSHNSFPPFQPSATYHPPPSCSPFPRPKFNVGSAILHAGRDCPQNVAIHQPAFIRRFQWVHPIATCAAEAL